MCHFKWIKKRGQSVSFKVEHMKDITVASHGLDENRHPRVYFILFKLCLIVAINISFFGIVVNIPSNTDPFHFSSCLVDAATVSISLLLIPGSALVLHAISELCKTFPSL